MRHFHERGSVCERGVREGNLPILELDERERCSGMNLQGGEQARESKRERERDTRYGGALVPSMY